MPPSTPATELFALQHPIVLAPMDAVGGGALAAAVTTAGGLGMIGGGYGDRDWLEREFRATQGKRVGCGFITWSLTRDPRLLDLALQHRPAAIMLSFGDPTPFAPTIAASGTPLICQIHTREHADRALDAGADVLVAQGCEAGGHGWGTQTTMTLVPEVADLIAHRDTGTVLLAAGGIADGRGLAAALALGAHGALVGTRFYATREALSTPQARERVLSATGADAVRTSVYDAVRQPWPAEYTANVLRNDFVNRWHGAEDELRHREDIARAYREAVAQRDYDTANVTAGQAAGLVESVEPAGDVVTGMAHEAARLTPELGHEGRAQRDERRRR